MNWSPDLRGTEMETGISVPRQNEIRNRGLVGLQGCRSGGGGCIHIKYFSAGERPKCLPSNSYKIPGPPPPTTTSATHGLARIDQAIAAQQERKITESAPNHCKTLQFLVIVVQKDVFRAPNTLQNLMKPCNSLTFRPQRTSSGLQTRFKTL